MSINLKLIRNLTIAYLGIPYVIFMITWVKRPIFLFSLLACCGVIYNLAKKEKCQYQTLYIAPKLLVIILLAVVFWCWTSGIGGFFYQSEDHHYRNAVFHDLISCNWPVLYEEYDTGLVYYLGIWIIPAVFGKLVLKVGLSQAVAWSISNIILLIWCVIGVSLLILLLCTYFKFSTWKRIGLLIFILMFFSGLDIIGELLLNGGQLNSHIEWWAGHYQFRSMTTSLFWAYNQAIPCWLMTILILLEKNVKNYVLITGITLFYAPFPVIGVIPFMIVKAILIILPNLHKREIKKIFLQVFSYNNVTALCTILPIFYFYYRCNTSLQAGIRLCWMDYASSGLIRELILWCLFYFLEAGIYAIFLFKSERKNPIFYVLLLTLMITSGITIGEKGEVAFRISASMPSIFIMMCMVIKKIDNILSQKILLKREQMAAFLLVMVILTGAATPGIEYGRAGLSMLRKGTIFDTMDNVKTFYKENASHNFVGKDISKSFFYRYIAQ